MKLCRSIAVCGVEFVKFIAIMFLLCTVLTECTLEHKSICQMHKWNLTQVCLLVCHTHIWCICYSFRWRERQQRNGRHGDGGGEREGQAAPSGAGGMGWSTWVHDLITHTSHACACAGQWPRVRNSCLVIASVYLKFWPLSKTASLQLYILQTDMSGDWWHHMDVLYVVLFWHLLDTDYYTKDYFYYQNIWFVDFFITLYLVISQLYTVYNLYACSSRPHG